MKCQIFVFLTALFICSQEATTQSKFSITPGAFYNGTFFMEDVGGFGAMLGVDYRPYEYFSVGIRTRYGYYTFDDGTSWSTDKDGYPIPPKRDYARLEYKLTSPQIGLVPKLYLALNTLSDDPFYLFLENELSFGWMSGDFKYNGKPNVKRSFTEPILSYNVALGLEFKWNKETNDNSIGASIGYSTLNFRNKIREHQPDGYIGRIPNQDAILMVNLFLRIPLR